MRSRHRIQVLASLLLIAAVPLIFGWALYPRLRANPGNYLEDRDGYLEIARNVASGKGYALDPGPHPTLRRMPAYPLLLALLLTLLGECPGGVLTVQALLVAGAALCCYGLARRESHRAGMAAMLLLGLYPQIVAYAPRYYSEILTVSLMAGGLWALQGFLESGRPICWLAASALFAGAFLSRTSVFFFLAPAALLVLREDACRGRFWKVWLPGVLIFVICLAPWAIRNWVVAGMPTVGTTWNARSALHGLALALDPAAEVSPREIDDRAIQGVDSPVRQQVGSVNSIEREVALDAAASRMYIETITRQPGRVLLNWLRGLCRIFFLTSSLPMRLVMGTVNLGLALLIVAGFALPGGTALPGRPITKYLLLLIGTTYGLFSLLFPMVRYLLPAVPAAAALGGIGASRLLDRIRGTGPAKTPPAAEMGS